MVKGKAVSAIRIELFALTALPHACHVYCPAHRMNTNRTYVCYRVQTNHTAAERILRKLVTTGSA